ncbi:MAG: polysaccharide biosynthesis C-terminal domain-containing protein, partial [Nocardioidaceae bacterium]
VLTALSCGYYASVALGFNAYVLQVYGRLRYLVMSNVTVAGVNLLLAFVLIPRYGAAGAAIANAATVVGQNVANQFVLTRTLPAATRHRGQLRPYLVIGSVTVALVAVQLIVRPGFLVALAAASLGSLVVLWLSRSSLELSATFPELKRVPVIRHLIR